MVARARTGCGPEMRVFREKMVTIPIALTIAGSDSSGGAGIQADLKTFAALGVYGASAITALTAQNTPGVSGIHQVPAEFITAQIDAVFSDLAVGAVKIGMVSQPAVMDAIVAGLTRWTPKHVVLDPVMVATSGDRLPAAAAGDGAVAGGADGVERSRGRRPGQATAGDGMQGGADQGRSRRGQREHRLSRRCERCHRAGCAARRHKKYPRHRLLAVV